ncbi:hypothetical protein Ddye_021383 [Dipteronia dyeriana]|uniref:DUF1985 domain-containing protein n=1 Tax=Dipteronia dyeriana TaxID=168575 RepID=A0AAD9WXH5_9ROSI|nr:hypothetical protein Ddye_021383 [Dipteronia dyeriana]
MRFMLGHHSVKFSKVEFCLITGLHFGAISDMTMYDSVENDIHEQHFPGIDEVDREQLRVVLSLGIFEQPYSAVRLYLIYILNWILIGVDERVKFPVWLFWLVEDLDAFLCGAHVYSSLYNEKDRLEIQKPYPYQASAGAISETEGSDLEGEGGRPSETEGSEP